MSEQTGMQEKQEQIPFGRGNEQIGIGQGEQFLTKRRDLD